MALIHPPDPAILRSAGRVAADPMDFSRQIWQSVVQQTTAAAIS